MKRGKSALLLCSLLGLSSCAAALRDSGETVSVQTTNGDASLTGAQCKLSNQKGNWLVITPMSTSVHRGSEPLQVACTKPGYQAANLLAKSSPNMGTILIQGAVWSTVSGTAWSYPSTITVPMQVAATGTP